MVNVDSKKLRRRIMARERMKKYRKKLAYEKAVRDEILKSNQNIVKNHDYYSNLPDSSQMKDPHHGEDLNRSDSQMIDFKEELKCWAVKHCITKRALNDLLSILIVYGFSFLPKDSRTFMKTPVNVEIRELSHGKLWYHGIRKYLELIFYNVQSDIIINLDFNFDGVDLFNSSKTCFWPIIASIRGILVYKRLMYL